MGTILKRAEILEGILTDQFLDEVKSEAALILEDEAKKQAPLSQPTNRKNSHPGNLRDNTRRFFYGDLDPIFVGPVAKRAPYAHFVHGGTKNQASNPYLYRAFVATRNLVANKMISRIDEKLKQFRTQYS